MYFKSSNSLESLHVSNLWFTASITSIYFLLLSLPGQTFLKDEVNRARWAALSFFQLKVIGKDN